MLENLCVELGTFLHLTWAQKMFVHLSSILIKFSTDLLDASNIKDASSAKRRYFIFVSFYVYTFNIWALSDLVW